MSTYTGFDMAPSALRWTVRDDATKTEQSPMPVFGLRGCPRLDEYDSGTTWSDPMAFRQTEFESQFEDGVEKTVEYLEAERGASDWLRSFFRSSGRKPTVDAGGTLAVAVPDHSTPDERDDVLIGLSGAKYANVSLVWRPVAIALSWLDKKKRNVGDISQYEGQRVVVLDLDGGKPELTVLTIGRHRVQRDWLIPWRTAPEEQKDIFDEVFEHDCYKAALNDLPEFRQVVHGQFFPQLQKALEDGDSCATIWLRCGGAWNPKKVDFAKGLPRDILASLIRMLEWPSLQKQDVLLVHGWIPRRYRSQLTTFFLKRCDYVEVMEKDAVSHGAALFAERLARGLPTFYDKIPDYRFWAKDSTRGEWIQMFDSNQFVEPGREYLYPEPNGQERQLSIEKFNNNVSFYVRSVPSLEYARRIKTDFAESLRDDVKVRLRAVVSPEKGSAVFSLTMCDENLPPIFVLGKTQVREIVLRWSSKLNENNQSISVEIVQEHQGTLEPQPVLGRIYDNEENLRLVELYVRDPHGAEFQRLWSKYSHRFHPNAANGIADRVGYNCDPREPTRGLFGTKYVFNPRIDQATHDYAQILAKQYPFDSKEGMKFQNYCHCGAVNAYKTYIRKSLSEFYAPVYNFNYYYAAGYVLGNHPDDLRVLMNYIKEMTSLGAERPKLWWSFFRMLCWHPECRFAKEDKTLLEECLNLIVTQDADIATQNHFAANDRKFLPLAILYALRIRESGVDLSEDLKVDLERLLTAGELRGIPFPTTMVANMAAAGDCDTLSAYVVRFIRYEDTLRDRELGAAMGCV